VGEHGQGLLAGGHGGLGPIHVSPLRYSQVHPLTDSFQERNFSG
jgi:hypothetical protein